MIDAPPPAIAYTVDRWAPGIWTAFMRAAWHAYNREPYQVSSWWRSSSHNLEVGGDPDSQHLVGTAFDCTLAAAWALEEAGFIVLRYPTHAHAQVWPAGADRRAGLLDAIGV